MYAELICGGMADETVKTFLKSHVVWFLNQEKINWLIPAAAVAGYTFIHIQD